MQSNPKSHPQFEEPQEIWARRDQRVLPFNALIKQVCKLRPGLANSLPPVHTRPVQTKPQIAESLVCQPVKF